MAYVDPTKGKSTSKDLQNQNNLTLRIPSNEEWMAATNNEKYVPPASTNINIQQTPDWKQFAKDAEQVDYNIWQEKFLNNATNNNNLFLNAYNKNPNSPVDFVKSTAGELFVNGNHRLTDVAIENSDNFAHLYNTNKSFKSLTDMYYTQGDVGSMMRIWNEFNGDYQSGTNKLWNGLKQAGTDAVVTVANIGPAIGMLLSGTLRTFGEIGEAFGIDNDYNFRDSTRDERRYGGLWGDFQRTLDDMSVENRLVNRIYLTPEEEENPWKPSIGNISQNVIGNYGATLAFMLMPMGIGALSKGIGGAARMLPAANKVRKFAFGSGKILQKSLPVLLGTYEGHMEGSMAAEEFMNNGKQTIEELYNNQLNTIFYQNFAKKGLTLDPETLNQVAAISQNPDMWEKFGLDPKDYQEALVKLRKNREDALLALDKQSMLVYGTTFGLNSLVNGIANQFTIKPLFNAASGRLAKKSMKFIPGTAKVASKGTTFLNKPLVKTFQGVISEGAEEWIQGSISEFGTSLGELNMDNFLASRYDPDNKNIIRSGWSVLGKSFSNGVSHLFSEEGLFDFAMGVVSTGTLMVPGFKKNSKYVKDSKNINTRWKYTFSPLYAPKTIYQQAKKENELAELNIKTWNDWVSNPENNEKLRTISMAMAHDRFLSPETQSDDLDIFEIKNQKLGQIFSAYSLAKQMDLKTEFKDFLNGSMGNLEKIIEAEKKSNEPSAEAIDYLNQAVASGLLKESDVTNSEKRVEALEKIKTNATKFLEKIDQMDKIADQVEKNYGDLGLDNNIKGTLIYAHLKRADWKQRLPELREKLNSQNIQTVANEIDVAMPIKEGNQDIRLNTTILKYGNNYENATSNLRSELAGILKLGDNNKTSSNALKEIIKNSNSSNAEKWRSVEMLRMLSMQKKALLKKKKELENDITYLHSNKDSFYTIENNVKIFTGKDVDISMSDLFLNTDEQTRDTILQKAGTQFYNSNLTLKINNFLSKANIDYTTQHNMTYEASLRDVAKMKQNIDDLDLQLAEYVQDPISIQKEANYYDQRDFMSDIRSSINKKISTFNELKTDEERAAHLQLLEEEVTELQNKDKSTLTADEHGKMQALNMIKNSTKKGEIGTEINDSINRLLKKADITDLLDENENLSDYEKTFLAIVYNFLVDNKIDLNTLKYGDIAKILRSNNLLSEEYKKENSSHKVLDFIFNLTEQEVVKQNKTILEARQLDPENTTDNTEGFQDIVIPSEYIFSNNTEDLEKSDKTFLQSGTAPVIKSKLIKLTAELIPMIERQQSANALINNNKNSVKTDVPLTDEVKAVQEEKIDESEELTKNVDSIEEDLNPEEIKENEISEKIESSINDEINPTIEETVPGEEIKPEDVKSTNAEFNEEESFDLESGTTDFLLDFFSEQLQNITDLDEIVWNSAMFPLEDGPSNVVKEYLDFHRVKDYLLSGRLEYYNPANKENSSKVLFMVDKALTENVKKSLENKGVSYVPKLHTPIVAVVEDPKGKVMMGGKTYQVLTIYTGNPTKNNTNLEGLIYQGESRLSKLQGDNNFAFITDNDGNNIQTYALPTPAEINGQKINQVHVNDTLNIDNNKNIDLKATQETGVRIPIERVPLIELNAFLGDGEFAIFNEDGTLSNPEEWELQSQGRPENEASLVLMLVKKNSANPKGNTILLHTHYISSFKNWKASIFNMFKKYTEYKNTIEELSKKKRDIYAHTKDPKRRRNEIKAINDTLEQLNQEIFAFMEDITSLTGGKHLHNAIVKIIKDQIAWKNKGGIVFKDDSETAKVNAIGKNLSKHFRFGTQIMLDSVEGEKILYEDGSLKSENSQIFNSNNWSEEMDDIDIEIEANRIITKLLSIRKTAFRVNFDDIVPEFEDSETAKTNKQNKLAQLVMEGILYTPRTNIRRVSKSVQKAEFKANNNTNRKNVTGDSAGNKWTWEYAVAVRGVGNTSQNSNPETIIDENIDVNTIPSGAVANVDAANTQSSNNTIEIVEEVQIENNEDEISLTDISDDLGNNDSASYKKVTTNDPDFIPMDLKTELEYLRTVAPYYFNEDGTPLKEAFDIVEAAIDIHDIFGNKTDEAYGKYSKGKILLSKTAPKGIALHESVHAILDLFFTADEKGAFLQRVQSENIEEVKTLSGTEEYLAETFRKAIIGESVEGQDNSKFIKNSYLQKLIYKIKALFGLQPKSAKEFFYRINTGYYQTTSEQLQKYIDNKKINKQTSNDQISPIPGSVTLNNLETISLNILMNRGDIIYTDENGDPCK